MKKYIIIIGFAAALLFACGDDSTGPNEIGGDANIELTEVGSEFGVNIGGQGDYIPALGKVEDSIYISKNEGGIVTFSGELTLDLESIRSIDTLLGTSGLSESAKREIVDQYLDKYGLSVDTTDHDNMKLILEDVKFKITSEGIQDFVYSDGNLSKPFTIAKYSSKVGDKYEFTTDDGKKITRTVVQTHGTEDWDLAFWTVKTMRVEQPVPDDPIMSKVTFVANHKFGLVGAIYELKDGQIFEVHILPWHMMD